MGGELRARPLTRSPLTTQADDGEPFAEKMARLSAQWRERRAEAARLDEAIEANLRSLGFSVDAEENHASPD